MAASDPARELMRMADAPQRCGDCAVFALLEDVIRSALLQGSLGRSIQAHQAIPPRVLGNWSDQTSLQSERRLRQAGIERVAKVRGSLYGCLDAIDAARKAITAIARDGDGMTTAAQVEVRHRCGVIGKQAKKARETLAATGLRR